MLQRKKLHLHIQQTVDDVKTDFCSVIGLNEAIQGLWQTTRGSPDEEIEPDSTLTVLASQTHANTQSREITLTPYFYYLPDKLLQKNHIVSTVYICKIRIS